MQALNDELPTLEKIEQILAEVKSVSLLTEHEGESIELPGKVFQILKQVVSHMAQGRTVFLVPAAPMLTTREAADLLNVSESDLLRLLTEGKIPFTQVRTRRRIFVSDLLAYKKTTAR